MAQIASIPVTVAATQAHRQFGDMIRRAFLGKEHFVIEKDGLPVAIILSPAEHAELLREHERQEEDKQACLRQFREAARVVGAEVEQMSIIDEQVIHLLEETMREAYRQHTDRTPS